MLVTWNPLQQNDQNLPEERVRMCCAHFRLVLSVLREKNVNAEPRSTAWKRECVNRAQDLHSAQIDLHLFYIK